MDEILLVDKPKGWTSFDIVAKIRSNLRKETGQKVKVGHAGTLDPLATGLLIVLVGNATKQQDEFMKQDKVYEVELRLGLTSTTADDEGTKTKVSDRKPNDNEIKDVLNTFLGEQQQVPPAFSAIKVNGQRAYKLARAGKEVKIKPRTITIYSITDVNYDYPALKFTAKVSSGTYIRSLVTDIGEKLGTGAYMTELRRTQIGNFKLSEATSPEELNIQK
jgi:tRNA pseudouridine55 synthase